jgi:hypothetical protein
LWNGYGINVKGVRSYIQQQKLQQDKTGAIRVKPRKWFRPRSVKKMLIEMDKPFVWPEVPGDLELYVDIPMTLSVVAWGWRNCAPIWIGIAMESESSRHSC